MGSSFVTPKRGAVSGISRNDKNHAVKRIVLSPYKFTACHYIFVAFVKSYYCNNYEKLENIINSFYDDVFSYCGATHPIIRKDSSFFSIGYVNFLLLAELDFLASVSVQPLK